MPWRNVLAHDPDRIDSCEQQVICLMSTMKNISRFRRFEVLANSEALELVRDRLSQILDRAEDKC